MTALSRQCVILVGGLGTRLGKLTKERPKPLLDVAGKPFLAHLIENARRFGFDDFLLLAGHKSERVRAFAEDRPGVRVIVEPEPAGTAGALVYAREWLADEFLMLNGDSLFDFNWLDLAARPLDGDWTARLALRQGGNATRFGRINIDGDHIHAFHEKSETVGSGLINAGVYWLRREIADLIKASPCSLERDIFPVLAQQRHLLGFIYDGPFIDIGVPEDLDHARNHWRDLCRRPAVFFDRDGVLNHDGGYTHRIEDFRWIDGAKEAVRRCNDAGCYVFVVTNQAGIARGFYGEAAVEHLHAWMNEDLRTIGAHIDDFRYCPHHPDGVVPDYAKVCTCRKPAPGMIESLLREWPVDVEASVLIGDKDSDITAAVRSGVKGLLFSSEVFRGL